VPYFRFRFVKPETGRLNTARRQAFDEVHCREILAREGIADVRDLVVEEEPGATDRQLAYLRDLGGVAPPGVTMGEISDLIRNRQKGRQPAGAYERGLAALYRVEVTRFASKHAIYKSIAFALAADSDPRELVNWYVYRVYRTSFDRSRGAPVISIPSHSQIRVISDRLTQDAEVVRSIRREAETAQGWRWFGKFRAPDGQEYQGASTVTSAYRTTLAALMDAALCQVVSQAKRYVSDRPDLGGLTVDEPAPTATRSWWKRLFGVS
jgi:hypothetical protein